MFQWILCIFSPLSSFLCFRFCCFCSCCSFRIYFFSVSLVIFHVVRSHCDIQLISNATDEMKILDALFVHDTKNKHWTTNVGQWTLIVANGNGKLIRWKKTDAGKNARAQTPTQEPSKQNWNKNKFEEKEYKYKFNTNPSDRIKRMQKYSHGRKKCSY